MQIGKEYEGQIVNLYTPKGIQTGRVGRVNEHHVELDYILQELESKEEISGRIVWFNEIESIEIQ